ADLAGFDAALRERDFQLYAAAQEVQAAREEIVAEARGRLGRAFNPADYPTDLAALFGMEVNYPSLQPDGTLPPALLQQQRRRRCWSSSGGCARRSSTRRWRSSPGATWRRSRSCARTWPSGWRPHPTGGGGCSGTRWWRTCTNSSSGSGGCRWVAARSWTRWWRRRAGWCRG